MEAEKAELEIQIEKERLVKPKISAEFMTFWLHRFRKLDVTQKSHRQMLIDTFVNAIYVYDDKLLLTYNLHKSARVCHLHGLFPPFRRRFSATLSGLLATQTIFLNNERGTSKNAVTTFKEVHRNDGLQENSYASKYGVQPTRNGTQ